MNENARRGRPLHEIETWVFDLDNTLYPSSIRLFDQIEVRMVSFIQAELGVDVNAAHALRQGYLRRYGTTLRGMMSEHGLAPERFLDYVHAIDLSAVGPAPELGTALEKLPGRKLIFTNADTGHAERVLDRLGLARHFEGIFDVVAADYRPKPDRIAYEVFVRRHGIDPRRAAMIEDQARNLEPAHGLGMTTAWIPGGPHSNEVDPSAPHIHHVVDDLATWLAGVAPAKA
jgi:putative hydrolase of the HAD superfamily